jgi:hypothetical protein
MGIAISSLLSQKVTLMVEKENRRTPAYKQENNLIFFERRANSSLIFDFYIALYG